MMSRKIRDRIKWKLIKFLDSIYAICAGMFFLSAFAIFAVNMICKKESVTYNLCVAIFTGVIASTVVAVIMQIKQDKMHKERKRALLFDALFLLDRFENEMKLELEKGEKQWDKIYPICQEPAKYLIELHKRDTAIFDAIELTYLRKINRNYSIISRLAEAVHQDKENIKSRISDDDILQIDQQFERNVMDLQKHLSYLKIKWEKDDLQ